jgi:hypothetical protein
MTDDFEVADVKLVTIIAPCGLGDRVAEELRVLGASGYTKAKADGWGIHGARQFGLVESSNVRFDVLAGAAVAKSILQSVAQNFEDEAMVAFAQDVQAVPHRHFAERVATAAAPKAGPRRDGIA